MILTKEIINSFGHREEVQLDKNDLLNIIHKNGINICIKKESNTICDWNCNKNTSECPRFLDSIDPKFKPCNIVKVNKI